MGCRELAHESDQARDELGLAVIPVGKENVIGDVKETRVRPRLGDLAVDRKAAEPGVEHQDGRCGNHVRGRHLRGRHGRGFGEKPAAPQWLWIA